MNLNFNEFYHPNVTELQIRRRGCGWMKRYSTFLLFTFLNLTLKSVHFGMGLTIALWFPAVSQYT